MEGERLLIYRHDMHPPWQGELLMQIAPVANSSPAAPCFASRQEGFAPFKDVPELLPP
jgi:hypothetical protein